MKIFGYHLISNRRYRALRNRHDFMASRLIDALVYDIELNSEPKAPDGDDYNALLCILGLGGL